MPGGERARVRVKVTNYGAGTMAASQWVLHLNANENGFDGAVADRLHAIAPDQLLPASRPASRRSLSSRT